jgi:hypothetical protein
MVIVERQAVAFFMINTALNLRANAQDVTVPPVTGVLIRVRKVPETLPAKYSVVAFEGTGIVDRGQRRPDHRSC